MITVSVISKSDATGGGASRIASGLVKELNNVPDYLGHHWVGRPSINADWYTYKLHGGQWLSLIQGACSIFSRRIGLPDFLTPELFTHLIRKPTDYSLYHFHDISFTFSPIALRWLAQRKPIIWTFHDCSPFTGGCIAPLDCQSLYTGCKNCPQLHKLPLGTSFDFTGFMQRYKVDILNQLPIFPVMPSNWLAQQAKRIIDFKIDPVIIPNYVDLNIYKPQDKNTIRNILGLPQNRFIVLLTSTSLSDYHKGNHLAVDALKQVSVNPLVLAIGKLEQNQNQFFRGLDTHATGYIYNDQLLALYYAAADVFLFPTLADSFGCVAIETMACGTPSIAFSTGGVPEIIEHNINGWLTKTGNLRGLVDGLNHVINNPNTLDKWRYQGLNKVNEFYTKERFLDAHIKVYQQALDNYYANV